MSQSSVDMQADAFPGMLNGTADHRVRSLLQGEASAEVEFGTLVVDDGAGGAKMPDGTDAPLGVVVHSHDYAKDGELGDTGLKPGALMNVLTEGEVWVRLEENVSAGDVVRVSTSDDTNERPGRFRTTEPGDHESAVLSGAKYLTDGEAGGVALVWINMLGATMTQDS